MSRYYGMSLRITNYDPRRAAALMTAAETEWPFAGHWSDTGQTINSYAEDNIVAGVSEREFAERLAAAIWRANGAYCEVEIVATYLEDHPTEGYRFRETDYQRLFPTKEKTMTHEIRVLVTLQVEDADERIPISIPESQDAAVEAVENAVRAAHGMGFSHALGDNLCIGFVDAVLYEEEEDEDDPDG